MTAKNIETLKTVYLFIYDEFAATTKDIREKFGFTNAKAYNLGCQLEDMGLVCGEIYLEKGGCGATITAKNHPGTPVMWQCWESYDYIERDEAVQLFDSRVQKSKELWSGQTITYSGEIRQPK